MKQKIYLSVDLDYWCCGNAVWTGAVRMMNRLIKLDKPIIMVADHEKMLEHIDKYPADMLINVDAHSDIWDYGYTKSNSQKADCSNWVNYVRWQKQKEYLWYHSHLTSLCDRGCCHLDHPSPFVKRNRPKYAWATARYRCGLPTRQQIKNVIAVGIAISEDWLNSADQVETALHVALKHKIKLPDVEKLGVHFGAIDTKLLKQAKEKLT